MIFAPKRWRNVKRQGQSRLMGMLLDNNDPEQKGLAVIGTKRTYEKII
jgi:hypothetical protein